MVGLVLLVVVIGVAAGGRSSQPTTVTGPPAAEKAQGDKPAAKEASKPEIAQVGQTASRGGWEITVLDFGPYERFAPGKPPATKAQGALLVADMRIKNLQNSTSNFTQNDFALRAPDGREFKPAGQTATIDRGFMLSQTVQPGLTSENRVVFDVDPAVKEFTLTALGMQFAVRVP